MVTFALQRLAEELEDFKDLYAEYEGVIDDGEIESLEIHASIGVQLRRVARSISKLRRAASADRDALEDVEEMLSEVGDAFAELAASL